MTRSRIQGDLPERTLTFSVQLIELVDRFPSQTKGWVVGKQLLRSGTSIGANIREAEHAISDAEFVQRCSIARKEAAETRYWLEVVERTSMAAPEIVAPALQESDELLRILSSIVRKSQVFRQHKDLPGDVSSGTLSGSPHHESR